MFRAMKTANNKFQGGISAKPFAKLAAVLVALFILGVPQAMALTDGPDALLTKDELRARTIENLGAIESLRAAMQNHPSSHDYCRAVGHIVGSDNFARCWIAAEDNAKARAQAITKADALAAMIRALLAMPTTTDIKPAAAGVAAITRSRCYDRKTRILETCYDI